MSEYCKYCGCKAWLAGGDNGDTQDGLLKRITKLENALQEVADCKLFEAYDPTDCTEHVYETVWDLIWGARAALQEGE
jgi:hypothetical protein